MIHCRKSLHSVGYLNDDGMIRRHRYFEFDVNNTQIISGQFSMLPGQMISVDWGDGSARSAYSGINQAWSHDYGSAGDYVVRVFGSVALTKFMMDRSGVDISLDIANLPAGLTYFGCSGSNTVTGDIVNLPIGLTYFSCWGSNTVTGDIANLPTGLTVFKCWGSNTVTGDIANLPVGLTYFSCWGNNTVTGNIANLPTGFTYFGCWGSNTVTGDIANLPAELTYFSCWGNNTISGYSGKMWTMKPATFKFGPVSPGGLSTAEVDQLLIDFDADLTWASGNVINLTGTNAVRSSASDAAVANIESEGATVITN